MRIGRATNGISCEYAMQDKLKAWLIRKELKFIDEFWVAEASRIPDFLVLKDGHLINIEAKCNDFATMLRQLDDNSAFCDYSFAYITDCSLTPEWFKKRLHGSKYGLIVYNYDQDIITEVLEAHINKSIDKQLKKTIIDRIHKETIVRKKRNDVDTQQKLFEEQIQSPAIC